MFDQAGMLREVVKWDYELRLPVQAAGVVQRAMEVMMTSPRGPAYLSLPREVLGGSVPASNAPIDARAVPTTPYPDPRAIERLAESIAAAERPLIITGSAGRTPAAMAALATLGARRCSMSCASIRGKCVPSHSLPRNRGREWPPSGKNQALPRCSRKKSSFSCTTRSE
jgi:thiamine pyrophosphate-dependent acetolactate synthase large subunit-like protein